MFDEYRVRVLQEHTALQIWPCRSLPPIDVLICQLALGSAIQTVPAFTNSSPLTLGSLRL